MTSTRPPTILVVDDSEHDLIAYRRALRESGYELQAAQTLAEGLALAAACRPELVLLDYNLPDGDGLEFIRRMNDMGIADAAAVIMLTGSGDEAVAVAAMKAGASDYLIKDVAAGHLKLLPAVIERVRRERADRRARRAAEAELERYRRDLEELVRQKTAALLETEARASLILQSSADGLYGVDTGGLITFINPAACAMLGYRADQAIGRSAHALFHHSTADGAPYALADCPSHNALQVGEEIRVDDEVYWHADGHAVPVMYAVHPMVWNGEIAGAVISVVDISVQRAAAQAREQALVAAENLARVRREFLANMSHEIRTPLNAVLGFAHIGYRHYQDSAKVRNAFAKIQASGEQLLGVIDDILDFSRIEAGKLAIEHGPVRLAAVIERALDRVREHARGKGLQLRVDLAPDLPQTCVGDALRLGQILVNLLANAVKFSESGSVALAVCRDGDALAFTVADTGIGMSEAQLAQLFNPFQQADGSMTRRFGGSGLGLAICKRLLELMGGDIRVESRLGRGSTFEFRLPYVACAAAPLPEAVR